MGNDRGQAKMFEVIAEVEQRTRLTGSKPIPKAILDDKKTADQRKLPAAKKN